MLRMTAAEIAAALGYKITNENAEIITTVTCDSRKVEQGSLFVALVGEKSDGHDYLAAAYAGGAAAAVVSRDVQAPAEMALIHVGDGLKFLQELAALVRNNIKADVVAVTGSYGKTSTKDLLGGIFGGYKSCISYGNNNNELGLPLTLCRASEDTKVVVTEMGMRGFGQIDFLCRIARPKYAIITNIGTVHSELLGSQENIAKAKCEILPFIPKNGAAVLNWQDKKFLEPYLKDCQGEIIWYNCHEPQNGACAADVNLTAEKSSFTFLWGEYKFPITLNIAGEHNVVNCLSAIVVALKIGVPIADIQSGLAECALSGMRLKAEKAKNGALIINDSYNANPEAMRGALQVLSMYRDKKKIAVLGDMYELGAYSRQGHEMTGRAVYENKCEMLLTVGELAKDIAAGAVKAGMPADRVFCFDANRQAADFLKNNVDKNCAVLVKGSRGMQMEEIVQEIMR